MKNNYEYKRPTGDKYIMTPKQWKETFGSTRGRTLVSQTEVYIDESQRVITFHHVVSPFGKVFVLTLSVIFFPFLCMIDGYKSLVDGMKDTVYQKKMGRFGSDAIFAVNSEKQNEQYEKVLKLVK